MEEAVKAEVGVEDAVKLLVGVEDAVKSEYALKAEMLRETVGASAENTICTAAGENV